MATSKGTKMPRGDKTSIMQYEVPMFDLNAQNKVGKELASVIPHLFGNIFSVDM